MKKLKNITAITLIVIFCIGLPFSVALLDGFSFWKSVLMVPVFWGACSIGTFIGKWCSKTLFPADI